MKTRTSGIDSLRPLTRGAALGLALFMAQASTAAPKADQKGAEALIHGAKRPSLYSKLPSELDAADLKPLVDQYERLPWTVTRIQTLHGNTKSDKPSPASLGPEGYGPQAMAEQPLRPFFTKTSLAFHSAPGENGLVEATANTT